MGAIYDTTLGAPAASIDTGAVLPTTYAHMMIEWEARGDTAAAATALQLRFNNDSAANYDSQNLTGSGAAATVNEAFGATSGVIGAFAAASAGASLVGQGVIHIANYGGTTFNKIASGIYDYKSGTATTNMTVGRPGVHWRSTAAINRVTLFPAAGNFIAGTRLTIYVMGA